jgi:hypothetical protein
VLDGEHALGRDLHGVRILAGPGPLNPLRVPATCAYVSSLFRGTMWLWAPIVERFATRTALDQPLDR